MSNGPYPQSPYEHLPFEHRPDEQRSGEQQPAAQRPTEPAWEQPTFTERDPQAPVWGQVIVPVESRLVVAPPSSQEETLRTIRRLVFPVALVIAIVTGHWFPVLVLAIIVSNVLRRQLWQARQRRLQLTTTLR